MSTSETAHTQVPRTTAQQIPIKGRPPSRYRSSRASAGSWALVARTRTVAGYAIPGIVLFFAWLVLIILAIILLAFIAHWAGGGLLNLKPGHFVLKVGFT